MGCCELAPQSELAAEEPYTSPCEEEEEEELTWEEGANVEEANSKLPYGCECACCEYCEDACCWNEANASVAGKC